MTLIPFVLKGMQEKYNEGAPRFPFDAQNHCLADSATATYCPGYGIVCHFYAVGEGECLWLLVKWSLFVVPLLPCIVQHCFLNPFLLLSLVTNNQHRQEHL